MALVKPLDGKNPIKLSDHDPDYHNGLIETDAIARSAKLLEELRELQALMYAAQETSVLVVLQGMDTAGKDGAIGHVMTGLNPQSCRVASFKVPTAIEAGHDFLWRIHQQTPQLGSLTIFNRSHYEDVLVTRVHQLVPPKVWKGRYSQIRNFEDLLVDNSTIILKFFIHISKDEQKERLLAREQDATKSWKLSVGDWHEREYWDKYQKAYQDALNETSVPHAPWYIVPSNHKWFRNLVIAEALVNALSPYRKSWMKHLELEGTKAKAELDAMRASETQK